MILGQLSELSVPTSDLDASIEWWMQLGFELIEKHIGEPPWDWAVVTDGQLPIVLHTTTDWSTPALSYFTGEADKVVASLLEKGMDLVNVRRDENDVITGGTLKSPEGQLIFILDVA
jgi:catechol 2,3-dioxygenase-like lactoylglutathione lyase family enzyme